MRVYEISLAYKLVSLGESVILNTPEKVGDYVAEEFEKNPMQETLLVLLLDRKGHPIGRHVCTIGTLTGSLASPKEIFRAAIVAGAAAVVLSHNHPGSDPAPSSADIQVTRRIKEAGVALDIEVLDHVIFGTREGDPKGRGYYSFREANLL